MSTKFTQIGGSKRSLHVQVACEMARSIILGELPEGEIIPGEMDLCTQFGVSRTALREAIKLLTSKGLLESKPKVGTRVRPQQYWNYLDSQLLDWLIDMEKTAYLYEEFLALRKAIEPEACASAARFASVEQRMQLSELFQKMDSIAKGFDQDVWVDVDLEFHRLIFISTGNSFFLPFANVLSTMFKSYFHHASKRGTTCIEEHRAIYEAIMAGNSEKARQASQALLTASDHELEAIK
ncbi:FadR/GntR family transcriptional regulator [Shewanella intestini]|uniref:FadR family transcriptional regulator n=1 Tax=Shewanella intestini TaxID=2017544 RepID=A0ABS5I4H4_9GAMM|nr:MULTISPECIES: FadR/GntR family transcriptional regulator [Shewanella]MBR9728919.1 FadR family transcriptional regulator [Shewanella intestini]MRG37015.1 FCD domain-containing protein [Shewanella sp. XMDDZSB0408]